MRKKEIITKTIKELDIMDRKCFDNNDDLNIYVKLNSKKLIWLLKILFFPKIYAPNRDQDTICEETLRDIHYTLGNLLDKVIPSDKEKRKTILEGFMKSIPGIIDTLMTDIDAAYDGDPAAISRSEIVLAYPSFEVLSVYRPAHVLYDLGMPIVPRIMSEYAHSKTGIDIHPGAKIGRNFFIDHGTGVVIGETCVIGDNVKIYQGVTLGAKSFEKDEDGNPIKGIKRHPNIGNNVVIYAGATILGGSTFIGDNCVIGGNVWLLESVEANSTVYISVSEGQKIKKKK